MTTISKVRPIRQVSAMGGTGSRKASSLELPHLAKFHAAFSFSLS